MDEYEKLPRGLRLNNPGNLRISGDVWVGEVTTTDKSFKQFRSIKYGYRAMIKLLQNYSRLFGCRTLRQMINRYAPPSENHTDNYLKVISSRTGVLPDATVAINNQDEMCRIVAAMSFVENGVEPNMQDIYRGWDLLQ